MQDHYVHAIKEKSKAKDDPDIAFHSHRRLALVFRDGDKHYTDKNDGGTKATNMKGTKKLTVEERHLLGQIPSLLQEGHVYERTFLLQNQGIVTAQGGVSGTTNYGCSAIVVSRQSKEHSEQDLFHTLYYSANGRQGGKSMFTSIRKKNPVRVFRTSELDNDFYASKPDDTGKKKVYRYDGLYQIVSCTAVEKNGRILTPTTGPDLTEYTYKLERISKGSCRETNQLDAEELRKYALEMGTMMGGPRLGSFQQSALYSTGTQARRKRRMVAGPPKKRRWVGEDDNSGDDEKANDLDTDLVVTDLDTDLVVAERSTHQQERAKRFKDAGEFEMMSDEELREALLKLTLGTETYPSLSL